MTNLCPVLKPSICFIHFSRLDLLGAVVHILKLVGQCVIVQLVGFGSLAFTLPIFSSGVRIIIRHLLWMETASTFA